MSEKLTRIRVRHMKNADCGFMDWGEKTRPEMVSIMRERAKHLREAADAIDETADHEFEIDVIRGPHVQKHIRSVP